MNRLHDDFDRRWAEQEEEFDRTWRRASNGAVVALLFGLVIYGAIAAGLIVGVIWMVRNLL